MTTDTSTSATAPLTSQAPNSGTAAGTPGPGGGSLLVTGARATGLALVSVMAAHGLSLAVGADLLVTGPDDSLVAVGAGTVAGMTLLGCVVAVLLAWAAARWAPRPRTVFVVTAIVGVLAYAGVPFAAAEAVSTAVWLNAYHVVVAVPLVALLGRRLPRRHVPVTA